jgi:hypothetical protein
MATAPSFRQSGPRAVDNAIRYVAPPLHSLRDLKDRLDYSGQQMAEMFGLAGSQQWHKYSGKSAPREMGLPMLFLAFALCNRSATVDEVLDICRRETGAVIDLAANGELKP